MGAIGVMPTPPDTRVVGSRGSGVGPSVYPIPLDGLEAKGVSELFLITDAREGRVLTCAGACTHTDARACSRTHLGPQGHTGSLCVSASAHGHPGACGHPWPSRACTHTLEVWLQLRGSLLSQPAGSVAPGQQPSPACPPSLCPSLSCRPTLRRTWIWPVDQVSA